MATATLDGNSAQTIRHEHANRRLSYLMYEYELKVDAIRFSRHFAVRTQCVTIWQSSAHANYHQSCIDDAVRHIAIMARNRECVRCKYMFQ